jgi:hypothetical protein
VPGNTVDVYCWDCSTYTISPEENPFFNPLAGNGPGDFINTRILNGLHLVLTGGGAGNGGGCPVVPPHPGFANLDANIAEAEQGLRFARTIANAKWFRNQVQNKGPWDYKQVKTMNDFGKIDPLSPYDDFGNFNYGATGAALGMPDQVLLRAAGWYQEKSGNGSPEFGHWWGGAPYGDDPPGQEFIKQGIQYYKNHCNKK